MSDIFLTNDPDIYYEYATASNTIYGLAGGDSISIDVEGEDVYSEIHGGDGNDYLTMYFGFGAYGSYGVVYGDAGNDTINVDYLDYYPTADGGDGDDNISSSGNAYGGAGDDRVNGLGYSSGGSGADYVYGDNADGGAGDDYISGDTAYGGDGSDELVGGTISFGGAGNDVLSEMDYAEGGSGHDVFISNSAEISISDFETGVDRFAIAGPLGSGDAETYIPTNVSVSDLLYVAFEGQGGDDRASGSELNELMLGRDGNDTLNGGQGNDWLFGGFGADVLFGDSGDDQLVGNAGLDILKGAAGADYLEGGNGNDVLYGGTGADLLEGSAGKDVMSGGTGADTFVFHQGDSGIGGANRDVIKDFEVGLDKLDVRGFAGYSITDLNDKAYLLLDADGDGRFEMQVNIGFAQGSSNLEFGNADIILI